MCVAWRARRRQNTRTRQARNRKSATNTTARYMCAEGVRAVAVRVHEASESRVVATREGEVGRGEDGHRGREAGDERELVELGVSADQLVGLGVLTAQASRQGGLAARGQQEHVRSSSQQRRRANQAP